MRELADRYGFTYRQVPSPWRLIEDGKFLDDFALDSVEKEVDVMYAAALQAGRGGEDRAVSQFSHPIVDALLKVFGSEIKPRVTAATITAWGRDPLMLGAYGA